MHYKQLPIKHGGSSQAQAKQQLQDETRLCRMHVAGACVHLMLFKLDSGRLTAHPSLQSTSVWGIAADILFSESSKAMPYQTFFLSVSIAQSNATIKHPVPQTATCVSPP